MAVMAGLVTESNGRMTPAPISGVVEAVSRVRSWLSARHSLRAELLVVVGLYVLYESTRGVVAGRSNVALQHAHDVVRIERSLHVFVEASVERSAERLSGLTSTLEVLYLSLHLVLTGLLLLWLHQRRSSSYPYFRTTLLLASGVALIGYLVFPTAPPRLSIASLDPNLSGVPLNIDKGLVSGLYNPYAAVPSMHAAYALVVGAALFLQARSWVIRVIGLAYPVFVVLVIVATGNHFLFDVGVGAFVDFLAGVAAALLLRGIPRRPAATSLLGS
jgi:PAP2 superfamily